MGELTFAVPTLFGLEGLCADEMRRLQLPGVQAENGRVLCGGSEADLPRLNLNLRTGERVLVILVPGIGVSHIPFCFCHKCGINPFPPKCST